MRLGDNPGMLSLVHDGNRNVSESLLQEEMGPIIQSPHPTSSPRPGQAGGDPPWGDGDTWDQERAWRRTRQLLLDAGGMSRHLCPYSCPPAKHNFRRCLTKKVCVGGKLAKAKGCLENPRSLHTVSPSLHRSRTGQTLARSLPPPAQAMGGGCSRAALGLLVPTCSWTRGHGGPCFYSVVPSLLSSFYPFSLPLCSTKPSG